MTEDIWTRLIQFLGSVELQTTDGWELKHHLARALGRLIANKSPEVETLKQVGKKMGIAFTPDINIPAKRESTPHENFVPVCLSKKVVVPERQEGFATFIAGWTPVVQMADGADFFR